MSKFWLAQPASANTDTWAVHSDDDIAALAGKRSAKALFKTANRIATGQLVPDRPIRFDVTNDRKRRGDLLWTEGGVLRAASDRFIAVLRDVEATGWALFDIDVRTNEGEALEGYEGLAITGTCGDLLGTIQPEVHEPLPGHLVRRGIDPSIEWDGSDLFGMRDRPMIDFCLTDRVKDALDDADIDRVEYIAAEDYELSVL